MAVTLPTERDIIELAAKYSGGFTYDDNIYDYIIAQPKPEITRTFTLEAPVTKNVVFRHEDGRNLVVPVRSDDTVKVDFDALSMLLWELGYMTEDEDNNDE